MWNLKPKPKFRAWAYLPIIFFYKRITINQKTCCISSQPCNKLIMSNIDIWNNLLFFTVSIKFTVHNKKMHKTEVHWVWIQKRNVLLWIPWYKLQKQSTFPSVHLWLWKTADTSKSGPWFDFLSTTGLSLVSIGKFMIIIRVKDFCLFLNVQLQGGIYGDFYESKFQYFI